MKILLLGPEGQLGWELQRALAPLGEVLACGRRSAGALQVDLTQPAALAATVRQLQPQLIVNAAAHTAVDKAETEPELAHAINATAPGVLAREAAALGVPLVHYSSDYVFDGSGSAPRDETAATGPLNAYGRSKLEGEELIRASGCSHLILRTSWVYAARGGNFARTMLRLAAERDLIKVIHDQHGVPTGADLLADVTSHAVRRLMAEPALAGTYHCVPSGQTNWYDYARLVIEWTRAQGQAIKVAPGAIEPIATSDYPTAAQRPLNSRLSTHKLQQALGLHLPPWQAGVHRMLAEVLGA